MAAISTSHPKALDKSVERIGFYGCNGELIAVGCKPEAGKYPPRKVEVECRGCGVKHIVGPSWRVRMKADREPELKL